jgi:toxin ParE1/3/4
MRKSGSRLDRAGSAHVSRWLARRRADGAVARVELAPELFDDFDRFFDHMARFEVEDEPSRIGEIVQAVQILTHSPLIGQLVKGGRRELVIGRDSQGYIVLYRFEPRIDTAFVLAIRSQRESGYKRER